ncbi:MAG: FtsX-like permease family protein [Acidimicrobiia bacterium]|nr:FtsX-like permease family protein [Acidimicrobiia bacterium]
MRKLTLRSLWSHKRRLISTVSAVVLGVGFMSGILVFSDTLGQVFDDLFATGTEDVDSVVEGEVLFSDAFGGDVRNTLDPGVVEVVQGVDGVAAANPFVLLATYSTRVLDTEGDAIGTTQGPPTLVESWIEDDELNAYDLTEGSRPPAADDEIALNVAAADDAGVSIGDPVQVYTQQGIQEYELVGTFLFGTAESSGGAVSADFTLAEAQRLSGNAERVNDVFVRAAEGVSPEDLTARIDAVLQPPAEVLTGAAYGQQTSDSIKEGFSFFTQLLLVFAVIALLVGAFIIYNTFQILVAQRTQELALLRAVGASKGQVLRSVLLEAIVIALVASALGVAFGIALANGVIAAFSSSGADLPTTGVVVRPATVLTAMITGTVITMLAALLPARRATKVSPLAAMRDVAVDRSGASKARLVIGLVLAAFAAFQLSQAWTAAQEDDPLPSVGMGAALVLVAAIVLGPTLAGPSVRVLGGLLPRFRGVTGRIATENAARTPKRTSATASALMIAVALVGFITVLAASAKESIGGRVDDDVTADVVVMAPFGGFGPPTGFSPALREEIAAVDGVETISPQGFAQAEITYPDGSVESPGFIGSSEPTNILDVLNPQMAEGAITDLTDGGAAVDQSTADTHGLSIGDVLQLTAAGGRQAEVMVQAIHDDPVILFPVTITDHDFLELITEALDFALFIGVADGADIPTVLAAVDEAAREVPIVDVVDREGFANLATSQVTSFVTFIYVMLALSVIIALIGIANTLSLSIYERTREIGLTRAVGANRAQVRSSMRWEAAIIAVLGTLVGLGIGLIVSWALITALGGFGLGTFVVPVGTLAFIVVVAALLGVLASLLPARRAAKLDILKAIAHS